MIDKIILLSSVAFSTTAQILLKIGMGKVGADATLVDKLKKMALSPALWVAIVLFGLSFVFYALALSKIDISRAYPIVILTGVVLVFSISIIFFHEALSWYKIAGMAFCIVGIILFFRG